MAPQGAGAWYGRSMPSFERDGVSIHYEVHGPEDATSTVLVLAPGGMRSTVAALSRMPWSPVEGLADRHRVVVMDQRNAGRSRGPIGPEAGWADYTADQLALLDHLGVEDFAALGVCIGGPFVVRLARAAKGRMRAGVMFQPIGLSDNRETFYALFDGWAEEQRAAHPEVDDANWCAFRERMFGGDFLFGATREDVAACELPLLVFLGDDVYHPASISREVATLAPNAELVLRWKGPDDMAAAAARVRAFLAEHG